MRRGMTVEALRNFMLEQGPSKNTNLQEWDKIWSINKDILDPVSHRYFGIVESSAVRLTVENGPESVEARSQPLHPKDAKVGSKALFYGKELLIERDDAATIQVGTKVTLIKWGNGQVHLFGTVDEADKDFKGTAKIHWVANEPSCTIKVKLVEFDHLITEPKIEEDTKVEDIVNHNSKIEYTAIAEGCLRRLQKGDIFQFERRGFYFVD
jgi:glutamyl-tRNA synthetase